MIAVNTISATTRGLVSAQYWGASDGAALSWLYERTDVMERRSDSNGNQQLVIRVMPERRGAIEQRFPHAKMRTSHADHD